MSLFRLKQNMPLYKVALLLIGMHFSLNSLGQTPNDNFVTNQVFAEIAGIGGLFSLNYEREFLKKKDFRFLLHLGLGTIHLKDFTNTINPDLVIPFALVATYGKKHHLEWGLGQTFTNIVKADLENGGKQRQSGYSTQFILGYRFQKQGRGLVYRLVYKPIIEYNRYFKHWGGVSIGYAF